MFNHAIVTCCCLAAVASEKHRFLLGHDERHWFVAGIPESTPVSRVRDAKQALKPDLVQSSERGIRTKYRDRRSNAARIRQGEWFFVPSACCASGTVACPEERADRAWRRQAPCP